MFLGLNQTRPNNGFGSGRIPPSEILAWQNLHRVQLTTWELDTITALDRVAMKSMNKPKPEST